MATVDKLVVQFDADFQRLKGALFKLDNTVRGTLKRIERRFSQLGKRMETVGKTMATRLTLPIALVGGAGLKMAGDFEQAMNQVAAVSGTTGAQFDALRKKASELGRETQFSASEVASAMSFMARAGLDADQIYGGVADTLKLAASAQLDLGQSADIVTNIMAGFGIQTAELGKSVDVLVAAFTSANTDLSQLGFAFKFAGGVAKSTGQSFNTTTAALALMGNAGFQATLAGTALRGALTRLAKPTGEVKKAIKSIGLEVRKSGGGLVDLREIIRQLGPHVNDAATFIALFGQRAGPGMLGLVRQGLPAFDALIDKLEKSGGIAERIAKVQMEGLNGALRALRSAIEGLAIAIGDSGVLQVFTLLAQKATELVRYLADLNPRILAMSSAVVGFVAVIGPLALLLPAVAKGFRLVAVASLIFARRLLLIPGAVVAAVAGLKNLGSAVEDAVGAMFDSSKDVSTTFVETLKQGFRDDWKSVQQTVGDLFGDIIGPEQDRNLQRELEVVNSDIKKMLGALQDDTGGAAVEVNPISGLGESVKQEGAKAEKALEDLRIKALEATGGAREAAQIEFNRELAKYQEMLDKKLISAENFEKVKANLIAINAKKIAEIEDGQLGNLKDAMQSVASGIENALSDAFDSGKFKAGEMVRAIVKDLALLAVRVNLLQPLFGGGPGGGAGLLGNIFAGVFHDGGQVGAGGAKRSVSPLAFARAPRFHSGGMPGLRSDEVPAILERGEMVIPKGGRRGMGGTQIVFNVSTPDAESFRRSEGQIQAMLSRAADRGRRNM